MPQLVPPGPGQPAGVVPDERRRGAASEDPVEPQRPLGPVVGSARTRRRGQLIITACIAAHPGRFSNGKLERAFASVMRQTRRPDRIVVVNDEGRRGAGWTRQQILDLLPDGPDEWMAWLDSDDEWFPQHLEACADTAIRTESWFVFPGYDAPGGDPLGHF